MHPFLARLTRGIRRSAASPITLTRHPLFWAAAILITLGYTAFYYLNYISYSFPWQDDIGLYGNFIYNISNGTGFRCGGYANCFGMDHFRPAYYLFVPFYRLFPDVFTLIAISIIATTLTAVVITKIAEKFFDWKISLATFVSFMVFPAALDMYLHFGAREALFPALFFALSLLFFLEKKFWPWAISLIMASLFVEYGSLAALGFVIVAPLHRRRWYWAVAALVIGAGYFFLASGVLMPAIRGTSGFAGPKFGELEYLGKTPGDIVKHMLQEPREMLTILTQPHKISFYFQVMWPLLFLPLLGIEFLLIPFAQFMLVLLPRPEFYANVNWHYYIPTVPFIFTAALVGLSRLLGWYGKLLPRLERLPHAKRWLPAIPIIAIALAVMVHVNSFASYLARLRDYTGFRHAIANSDPDIYAYAKETPGNAEVSAQLPFFPRFSSREVLRLYPDGIEEGTAQYVVLGTQRGTYPLKPDAYREKLRGLLVSGEFGIVLEGKHGDVILKRGHSTEKNAGFLERF